MEFSRPYSMTTQNSKKIWLGAGSLLALFVLLIVAVTNIDVQPVGPLETEIGLAALNTAVNHFFDADPAWSVFTDGLLAVAFAVACGFAALGLYQLFRRRSLRRVDPDLYLLASTYAVCVVLYLLFELFVVNYRPVLMNGELEASFPSSHTLFIVCIMGTAIHQFFHRIRSALWCGIAISASGLVIALAVISRLMCGVHWFTDILGGLLLGSALVLTYIGLTQQIPHR